jgi:hypothetical protein
MTGSKGVVTATDGTEVFIKRVHDASGLKSIYDPIKKLEAERLDPRCFPVKHDVHGVKFRDFRETVDCCLSTTYNDSPLSGPCTAPWLVRHMLNHGGSPMAFHQKFMSETRLDYTAHGLSDHLVGCKFLDLLMTYDQIDPGRSVAAELICRRLQMCHDRWRHKMPNFNAGSAGGDEDAHLLLGTYETRSNVGISPELTAWLGNELGKEANVAKERRKAREERALALAKK